MRLSELRGKIRIAFLLSPLAGLCSVILFGALASHLQSSSGLTVSTDPPDFALAIIAVLVGIPASYASALVLGWPTVALLSRYSKLTMGYFTASGLVVGTIIGLGLGIIVEAYEHLPALMSCWLLGVIFSVVGFFVYWALTCR